MKNTLILTTILNLAFFSCSKHLPYNTSTTEMNGVFFSIETSSGDKFDYESVEGGEISLIIGQVSIHCKNGNYQINDGRIEKFRKGQKVVINRKGEIVEIK